MSTLQIHNDQKAMNYSIIHRDVDLRRRRSVFITHLKTEFQICLNILFFVKEMEQPPSHIN